MGGEFNEEENQSLEELRDQEQMNVQAESEAVQEQESFGSSGKRHFFSVERRSFGHLWLVSYSDFMTIMMIFFLGLYGYTVLAKAALLSQQKNQVSYSEFAEMISKIKGPLGESMQVQEGVGKVTIQLSDKILFASGQAILNQNAKRTLEDVANSLKLVTGDIVVEGHTDNIPVRGGKYRSNWELSAARAFSVVEALSNEGVPQDRLAAWGFGEHRPVAANTSENDRAKNRRIEIILLKKSAHNK